MSYIVVLDSALDVIHIQSLSTRSRRVLNVLGPPQLITQLGLELGRLRAYNTIRVRLGLGLGGLRAYNMILTAGRVGSKLNLVVAIATLVPRL